MLEEEKSKGAGYSRNELLLLLKAYGANKDDKCSHLARVLHELLGKTYFPILTNIDHMEYELELLGMRIGTLESIVNNKSKTSSSSESKIDKVDKGVIIPFDGSTPI